MICFERRSGFLKLLVLVTLVVIFCGSGRGAFFLWAYDSDGSVSLNPLFTFDFSHFDGSMDSRELVKAGLDFSMGTAGNEAEEYYLLKYCALEKKIKTEEVMVLDQKSRCQKILSLMYEELLSLYNEDQTRIDTLFQDGSYNCVSSCILYVALCKACGIDVRAQRTSSHCFCRVYLDSGEFDVETTNPYGFEPGTRQQITDLRYGVVEKKKYLGRREICDRELAALVGKNMCSLYNELEVFDLAVGMAVTRMKFLDGLGLEEDSRRDFDAVCTNYVGFKQDRGEYYDGFIWLCSVIEVFGMTDVLEQVYSTALYNCLVYFTNNGDINEAQSLFEEYGGAVSDKTRLKMQKMLFVSAAQTEIECLNDEEAISYIQEMLLQASKVDGLLDSELKGQFENWLEFYWYNVVASYFNRGEYYEAYEKACEALEDVPSSSNLKGLKKQSLYNHDVMYHNKFAAFANAGEMEEARKVLEEGLERNPESTILRQDLNSILE